MKILVSQCGVIKSPCSLRNLFEQFSVRLICKGNGVNPNIFIAESLGKGIFQCIDKAPVLIKIADIHHAV
ncbi:MAG: hypothetical protein AMK71_01590 [Nitrospira bacterium SG8_35_4]|nr:MAG: hypothetical protein AMK71_01590 [Nitrospira bacterium SG8_35_4]